MIPVMEDSVIRSNKNSVMKRNNVKSMKRKKKTRSKKPSDDVVKNVPVYEIPSYVDVLGEEQPDRDQQELDLEKLVFGGDDDVLEELSKKKKKKFKKKQSENFFIQTDGDIGDDALQMQVMETSNIGDLSDDHLHAVEGQVNTKKPVWADDDDDNILVHDKAATLQTCHRSITLRGREKYKEYVQEKFMRIVGNPKWASAAQGSDSENSEDDLEDELLQKTGDYLSQSSSLSKGIIDIRKCEYLNEEGVKAGVIKSVEFHPTSKVALVAGFSGTATLYQVDGKSNPKIQSVHFESFPIDTAHFTLDGEQIVVGSREHGHFFYYDMIAGKIVRVPWEKDMDQMNVRRFVMSPDGKLIAIHGKYGNIHLVTAKTKEWVSTLKMNGNVLSIAFNKDGSQMFTHGDTGQIYVWDMSSRTCIHRFNDEGCVAGTSLAISPNQHFLAAGSDSGVVNIYEMSSLLSSSNPQPLKMLMNLTTEVTSLKFNCTSEILAMASSYKTSSIKLVHFPSISVFSNFPIQTQELRYINSLDISLNSGYLAFGNNLGKAYLYRLRHYGNY